MFEYLMPLLRDAQLSRTRCSTSRAAWRCGGRSTTAATRGVPWGISESAYNVVDRHGTYQYKAFGVPGPRLKRGLGDELVVAPYATRARRAWSIRRRAARNLRRLAGAGRSRATTASSTPIDYTDRATDDRRAGDADAAAGTVVPRLPRASPGHDAGRAGQRAARRPRWSSASTPIRACRPPSCCCRSACRATRRSRSRGRATRCACAAPPPAVPVRRFRTPHTLVPARAVPVERQLHRRSSPTPAAAPASAAAARSPARGATPTRDPGSQFIYLRDVRSGAVWSATYQPTRARAGRLPRRRSCAEKATFRRRDDDIADAARDRGLDRGRRRGAPADASTNHSDRIARDRGHQLRRDRPRAAGRRPRAPGVRQAVPRDRVPRRQRRAALPPAAARSATSRGLGGARAEPRGPAAGRRSSGRPTARASSAAAATPTIPHALDGRALSGTTGAVLDPIVSLRQRVRLAPGRVGAALLRHRHGARSRDARRRSRRSTTTRARAARTFALAFAHAQSGLRHLGISSDEALLFERLASRVLYADGSLRARADELAPQRRSARRACGRTASPATCRSCSCASSEDDDLAARAPGAAGAGVLAPQGAERRRRHPQRASRRATSTRCTRSSRRCSTRARGGRGSTGRAARTCCAATASPRPSARCSTRSRARCSRGERGELRRPARPPRRRAHDPPPTRLRRRGSAPTADAGRSNRGQAPAARAGQRPRRLRARTAAST